MRTRRPLAAIALLLAGTAFATAFDAPAPVAEVVVAGSTAPHPEARATTRRALAAYAEGKRAEAAEFFAVAARYGHVPAQWKLARMLAVGDGVEADESRAAALYAELADRFLDEDPPLRYVAFVADATREAGRLRLATDPAGVRAGRRHLWRAATTYDDAEARYLLAASLLDADHGPRQPKVAVAWLRGAVAKHHAAASVLLGELQIAGQGIAADPVAGLMLMASAIERADEEERPSLALRFQAAHAEADDATRVAVGAQMERLALTAAAEPVMKAAAD